MSLDFNRIKEIKLVDVMGRYGIPPRFKGEYAAAICPLSTHKDGDTSKSFSINLAGNYWRCFSESCNANNGGKKGGDVINFVALKEGISRLDAAKKLATWFGINDSAKPTTAKKKPLLILRKGRLLLSRNIMQRTLRTLPPARAESSTCRKWKPGSILW